MRIIVNGRPMDVEDGLALTTLLHGLVTDPARVAVALNGAVVPRGEQASRTLAPGDTIEVIEPVGGG